MRKTLLILGVSLVALGLAAVAGAAWTIPAYVSPIERDAAEAQVAINADHDAVIAWELDDTLTTRIQARHRSATGQLGPVRDVSTLGVPATDPRVALLPDGSALLAWIGWDGSYYRLQSRTLSPAGALGPIRMISPAGRDAHDPQLQANPSGDALLAWRSLGRIQVRMRAVNGALSATQTLVPAANASSGGLAIGVDADGGGVIVWQTTPSSIVGVRRAAGGTLAPTQTLGTGSRPQVAINPDGAAMVTWNASGNTLLGRAWSAGDVLDAGQTIGVTDTSLSTHRVVIDSGGNSLVVWEEDSDQITARARSAAGVLGPGELVASADDGVRDPEIGIDANGDVEIVWAFDVACCRRDIAARERLVDGTMTDIQLIGKRRIGPNDVAVAPDGTALTVFIRESSANGNRVQVAAGP